MKFIEYQQQAGKTAGAHGALDQNDARLAIAGMGLSGEAGEVVDYLKKVVGHKHSLDKDTLVKELGDVMWYVAEICNVIGVDMADVAERNIDKLAKRYPEGFSTERSVNRVS